MTSKSLCRGKKFAPTAGLIGCLMLLPGIGCVSGTVATKLGTENLVLLSPDKKIEIYISAQHAVNYSLKIDGQPVLSNSRLELDFHDGTKLGRDVQLLKAVRSSADSTWANRFGKHSQVRDHHNE